MFVPRVPGKYASIRTSRQRRGVPSILTTLEQIGGRSQVVRIEVRVALRCLQVRVACQCLDDVRRCALASSTMSAIVECLAIFNRVAA